MKKIILLASVLVVAAHASVINYTVNGVFSYSAIPTAITAGDKFTLTFDLDTSAVDTNADIQTGIFMNAISNLSFSLDLGSTGNYSGGNMTASQFLQLTDNWYGYDMLNFYASSAFVPTGLNFSPAESSPFVEFSFNLYSSSQDIFSLSAPTGETLGSVLPVLNLASFDNAAQVNLVFGNWDSPQWAFSNITSISVSNVPDAPSYLTTLFAMAFIGLLMVYAKRLHPILVR